MEVRSSLEKYGAFAVLLLAASLSAEIQIGSTLKRWDKKGSPESPASSEPAPLADQVQTFGTLEIRLLDGGFYRGKDGLYPGARLIFKNTDPKRRFSKNINVDFFELGDEKPLSSSKTFLNLKAGHSLERRYAEPLGHAWQALEQAPAVVLRVRIGKKVSQDMALERREIL